MRYEGVNFEGQTVDIDDHEFVNCTFKNCVLRYAGGGFLIEPFNCEGIDIKLEGAALRTSRLLYAAQLGKSRAVPIGGEIVLGGERFTKEAPLPPVR